METMPLTKLDLGTAGYIKEINCKNSIKRRLLDLGLIPNTEITPIMKSVAGDPIAYEVRNIILAIRKQDADKIIVFAKWIYLYYNIIKIPVPSCWHIYVPHGTT